MFFSFYNKQQSICMWKFQFFLFFTKGAINYQLLSSMPHKNMYILSFQYSKVQQNSMLQFPHAHCKTITKQVIFHQF